MNVDVNTLFKLVELLILPFAYYLIKRLDNMAAAIEKSNSTSNELKTILIGADGKNGIRSRVMRLEKKVSNLSLLQAARHGEASPLLEDDDDE